MKYFISSIAGQRQLFIYIPPSFKLTVVVRLNYPGLCTCVNSLIFFYIIFADTELTSVLHETWVDFFNLLATLLWKSGQISFPAVTAAFANRCTAIIGNNYSWMGFNLATKKINKQTENGHSCIDAIKKLPMAYLEWNPNVSGAWLTFSLNWIFTILSYIIRLTFELPDKFTSFVCIYGLLILIVNLNQILHLWVQPEMIH